MLWGSTVKRISRQGSRYRLSGNIRLAVDLSTGRDTASERADTKRRVFFNQVFHSLAYKGVALTFLAPELWVREALRGG